MKTESLTTEDIATLQGLDLPEPLASKLARTEGVQLYYREAPAEPSTFDPPEDETPAEAEDDNTPDESEPET